MDYLPPGHFDSHSRPIRKDPYNRMAMKMAPKMMFHMVPLYHMGALR